MPTVQNQPLLERFRHHFEVLTSQRFLRMEGLGNEVPFFICPFAPAETNEAKVATLQMARRLELQGIGVVVVDLYDLAIDILQKRGIWSGTLDVEASISKDELKEHLQSVLDVEQHLIPALASKVSEREFDILFLTGVGEVFPYIRSHNVLNNLQSTAKDKPTVIFFPGEYRQSAETGASLDLFSRIRDDKYYRAFNLDLVEV